MTIDSSRMDRLVGAKIPGVQLLSSDGPEIDLRRLANEPLVLCLYPGDCEPPSPSSSAPTSCAVQRASLREYALDFAAFGVKVAALSTEQHALQRERVRAEQLPFPLLSDGRCALAERIDVPTFDDFGVRRYRRLTLVCKDAAVAAVFYPVSPRRAAIQALSWLERSGLR